MARYAIIQTGGKQYQVTPGDTLKVEKLTLPTGVDVEFDQVLLVKDDDKVLTGSPNVPGAKVTASVISEGKGEKVIVFKFKAKSRYRRKSGHRQPYTEVTIKDILVG